MAILDDLRYELAPLLTTDADPQGDLDTYLQAIAAMFAEVESYALDAHDANGDDLPGWAILFDIDNPAQPSEALPWAAQFAGEAIPIGASDATARAIIHGQPNKRRGTRASIIEAMQAS